MHNLNKNLRIIHTLGFPLDFNGNVTRVLGEAMYVARLGCSVDVLVSDQVPKKNLRRAIESGVKIYSLKLWVPCRGIGWRINNLIPLYIETLKNANNDPNGILHIAAPTPVAKPLAVSEIGRRLKIPMVLDLHDPWSANPYSFNLISMLQTQIMKHVIKKADYVVVAHTALSSLIKRFNKNKPVDIIPNGVDTEIFKPRSPNRQLAEGIGINEEDVVVAFCGHIMEHKGLDVLVRSARIVNQKHKNVKFLIIGDGPAKKRIEAIVDRLHLRKMFRFVDFVTQELMAEYLSLADICVAPYKPMAWFKVSLPETPLKVVEYMALGKPVVMSKISDDNVVTWSGGGLLVTPGKVSELASKIINLVENERLRKIMGEKSRKYVEDNLSWMKIAKRLMEIYQSVGVSA